MTVHDLFQTVAEGGAKTATAVIATPLIIGGTAMVLRDNGKRALSQMVANMGIVIGFLAVALELFAVFYAVDRLQINPLAEVNILLLLAPLYLLVAGFLAEHLLHPGVQSGIRKKLRAGILAFFILGLLAFLLSKMDVHMVIWTNITSFLFFIVVLVAIFYVMVRKIV